MKFAISPTAIESTPLSTQSTGVVAGAFIETIETGCSGHVVEREREHGDAPLAPVVAVVESSAKQIMSEILWSVTSSEEQDVAIDENPACCAVERKPCISVKAVDSAHRRVLSLILLPFSSAEQESRLGDDEFRKENGT